MKPSDLKVRIVVLLTARGKTAVFGVSVDGDHLPRDANLAVQDDSDGKGPYIADWDTAALGPKPTAADGFTSAELSRPRPKPKPAPPATASPIEGGQ